MKVVENKKWKNDAGNQEARPRRQYYPETLDDIITVVGEAEQHRMQVRAVGSGHAWSEVARTPDYMIRPERLNAILPLDRSVLKSETGIRREHTLVHIQSGITVRDLNARLDAMGLGLLNVGGYDAQTFVGAMSTSTHGAGITFGPFSNFVHSIELVSDGGRVYRIEPAGGITDRRSYEVAYPDVQLVQDDDWFDAVAVSMGCMGVIYSVIIEVRNKYWLQERRSFSTWEEVKTDLRDGEVLRDNRHYEILLSPHKMRNGKHKCVITTRNLGDPNTPKTASEKSRSLLHNALKSRGILYRIVATLLRLVTFGLVGLYKLIPELKDDVLHASMDSLRDADGYCEVSYKVLNIGVANELPAISAELGVPLADDRYIEVIDRFLEIAEERREHENLYHTAPVSLRFVDSSAAFLSMMYDRPSCIIEIIMATGTKGLYDMMDRYEKELYQFGGRPHWGQMNTLTADPKLLRSLYPKYDRWLEIYRALNANGTFDSPFSERLGFPAVRAERATPA